jgi:hypothetical protein
MLGFLGTQARQQTLAYRLDRLRRSSCVEHQWLPLLLQVLS